MLASIKIIKLISDLIFVILHFLALFKKLRFKSGDLINVNSSRKLMSTKICFQSDIAFSLYKCVNTLSFLHIEISLILNN